MEELISNRMNKQLQQKRREKISCKEIQKNKNKQKKKMLVNKQRKQIYGSETSPIKWLVFHIYLKLI